jgi:hypothetical protein
MEKNKSPKIVIGALLIIVVVGSLVWYVSSKKESEAPNPPGNSVFYSGPFRSKGDPTKYYTADGKEVPASEVEGKSPAGNGAAGPAPNGGVGAGVQQGGSAGVPAGGQGSSPTGGAVKATD